MLQLRQPVDEPNSTAAAQTSGVFPIAIIVERSVQLGTDFGCNNNEARRVFQFLTGA